MGHDNGMDVLALAEVEEADEIRSDVGAESLSFRINSLGS
jgi:hypothetical protein